MAFRLYDECKNCKLNKTSGYGFAFRKEGGCLFPNNNPEYMVSTSLKCHYFQLKDS